MLSKLTVEMTFSLAYVLNVAFVALYHVARRFSSILPIIVDH